MTKEEIDQKEKEYYDSLYGQYFNEDRRFMCVGYVAGLRYADQETQRLKDELAYKDKEIEISHNENRRMERHFLETVTVINSLRELQTEDLKQLQSELTELKEKHKRDVESAFSEGLFLPHDSDLTAEQYYNETHKTK